MNLPTKLTVLRIIMIPIFIAFFFIPVEGFRFVALGIFALASFTDFLDGYLARKNNLVTDLGKFLDPIADKMLVASALIAICVDAHDFQVGVAICAMVILCRELMVSGFRIVASSKNLVLAADKLGKIKTVLQMISMFFLIPFANIYEIEPLAGDVFLLLATIMTLISGLNYVIKNRSVLSDGSKKSDSNKNDKTAGEVKAETQNTKTDTKTDNNTNATLTDTATETTADKKTEN